MTVVNFVVELNPLMVQKVSMLVQLFAIVHSLHCQKCPSQKHHPERVGNGVLGRGDGGSHG